MTLEGPKWLAMGSERGSFHLFLHPKWSRIIFGKTHFLPIFDLFLVPKLPIFKAFGGFGGPKWLAMGSKCAHFTCLGTPNGLGFNFGKTHF